MMCAFHPVLPFGLKRLPRQALSPKNHNQCTGHMLNKVADKLIEQVIPSMSSQAPEFEQTFIFVYQYDEPDFGSAGPNFLQIASQQLRQLPPDFERRDKFILNE